MEKSVLEPKEFNPVDHMETDEEIIDYLFDCLDRDDDPDAIVFQRACEYVLESKGLRVFDLLRQAFQKAGRKMK